MLIVFEGLHSAGKSTQVGALSRWLRARGVPVVRSAWNSSPPLGERISQLKIDNRLGPTAMVLMEAADLAYRYEDGLRAALARDEVVVCDRYLYSTVARGVSRGVDEAFVRHCFSFAPEPDIVFHLRCSAEATLRRRIAAGLPVTGQMCGVDIAPAVPPHQGYLAHQGQIADLYERVLPAHTVVLPGTSDPETIHARVVATVAATSRVRPVAAAGGPHR